MTLDLLRLMTACSVDSASCLFLDTEERATEERPLAAHDRVINPMGR
jgi:hypothetical protein